MIALLRPATLNFRAKLLRGSQLAIGSFPNEDLSRLAASRLINPKSAEKYLSTRRETYRRGDPSGRETFSPDDIVSAIRTSFNTPGEETRNSYRRGTRIARRKRYDVRMIPRTNYTDRQSQIERVRSPRKRLVISSINHFRSPTENELITRLTTRFFF